MARLGVILGLCMLAQLYCINSQGTSGDLFEKLTHTHLNTNIQGKYDAGLGVLNSHGQGMFESGLNGSLLGHTNAYAQGKAENEASIANLLKLKAMAQAKANASGSILEGIQANAQLAGGIRPEFGRK